MGQIVSAAAKPKRCNLNQLSQVPTPAAGEYILVSSDNSMNADGQGNFDCYIVGDGNKLATALGLHYFADKTPINGSKNAVQSDALYATIHGREQNYIEGAYITNTGAILEDASYCYSDFIPVEPGDIITWKYSNTNKPICMGVYSANKISMLDYFSANDVSGARTVTLNITGAAYIRCSFDLSNIGDCFVMANGTLIWEPQKGVQSILDGLQTDAMPTENSVNPAQSGGVYDALKGTRKNYITGKKYDVNNNNLVDDADYMALTDLIPVTGGASVTFSFGGRLVLFNSSKNYNDYFGQTTDPRTVTINSTAAYIGVSFPISRRGNVSLAINGVNYPIVLTEEILGAAEAIGTSFTPSTQTYLNSGNVQDALVELGKKLLPSSFVFGKMINNNGTISDYSNGGYCEAYIPCTAGIGITFNTRAAGAGRWGIIVYNSNKSVFNYYSQTVANRTITTPPNTAYIRFNFDYETLPNILLRDIDGNSLLPEFDSMLYSQFVKYCDEEGLGVTTVQDAITEIVREVRHTQADVVKLYRDKEYDRDNLIYKSDFSCLFFSDLHGLSTNHPNLDRILSLADAWSDKIDCIINGGDTIENNSGQDIAWYQNIVAASEIDILTAIGNHDVYKGVDLDDGSLNTYTKYIKPTIDNVSNIVQPSDAGTVGKCYYYKDYNEKVRVIVLDAYSPNAYWDSEEETWLQNALSDARTNGLTVLCVTHIASTTLTPISCSFVSEITVGRWEMASGALDAVESFISGGGKFAGWLCGHCHYDYFGYPTGKPGQHTFVTMSARYDYGPGGFDTPRSGDSTKIDYDSFNLIAIDVANSLFKVLRIGVNLDFKMHAKNVLVYDYANREVISNW